MLLLHRSLQPQARSAPPIPSRQRDPIRRTGIQGLVMKEVKSMERVSGRGGGSYREIVELGLRVGLRRRL